MQPNIQDPANPPLATQNANPKRANNKLFFAVIAVLVVVAAGCILFALNHKTRRGPETTLSASTVAPAQVSISSHGFLPATITVKVGQAVVWTNQDSKPHVVASDPYPTDNTLPGLNSQQQIMTGEAYSYIFKTAGKYTYHDNLNPAMAGTVIVGSSLSGNSAK